MSTIVTNPSPGTSKRNLVFTSAGDRANLHFWLAPERNFDLWISYYGDQGERYRELAEIYMVRKGSKFQNLHHSYQLHPEIFASYDAIMVMDDDIVISAEDIERLFQLQEKLDLWVLQPAFSPLGRISLPITRVQRTCRYRYTSFVEMTCPLFRRDKLEDFMKVYDPILLGYGCDWWFLDALGDEIAGKVAVIDEITCVNPWVITKGKHGREMDRLQSLENRKATWREVRKQYGIRSINRGMVEYSVVHKTGLPLVIGAFTSILEHILIVAPHRIYVKLKRWLAWPVKGPQTARR